MSLFTSFFGKNKTNECQEDKQKKKNFEILKYNGIRARNMNQIPYAIKCFKEAIALNDDTETMGLLASIYIQNGQIEEARNLLNRLCEKAPENIEALLTLAHVCERQQDYSSMLSVCEKILRIDSNNTTAYYLAGKAMYALRDNLQAIAMLTKATMQNEAFTDAYLLRAEVLWNMRQAKDALEDIDKVLSLDANEEKAILLKGEIEATLGHSEQALKHFNQVTALNPFNENAYLLKGALLIEQKDFDKAIENYEEAIELMPDNAQLYQERGRARLLKGDKNGSMEDLKKAIELNPDNESLINGSFNNFGN